ncbi:hypothetical protein B0H17DRAFT_1148166 [Mycena rosella]|uniref:Uncharacterized protein n=1 Tax=Mycena rosella TaxID=1033263 RepID=A0AAD7FZA4_MYCRO|nr:hypothetical protein B0H17DRAFT_1148166 [Mycena rosella]
MSVAQHTDGGPIHMNLDWVQGNWLPLKKLPEETFGPDVFAADLFYEPSATLSVPAPPINLTGAKTNRLLDIAQQRHEVQMAQATSTKHTIAFNADFGRFLREFAESGTLPDFNAPTWVTSPGWEQYRNGTFTQLDIIKAAGLMSTAPHNNVTLFTRAKLLSEPLEHGQEDKKARRETAEAYQQQPKAGSSKGSKQRREETGAEERSGKKLKKRSGQGKDGVEKKRKEKGKQKPREVEERNSDDLDDDSGSSSEDDP